MVLLGPPGSGKSTLSKQLALQDNAKIFRLREYAQMRAAADSVLAAAMRDSSDSLGWLPDRVALGLVREAVNGPFRPLDQLVVFEGYPGNGLQAERLVQVLRRLNVPLLTLLLVLPPYVAYLRALRRRVCPHCDAESGEAHRPALLSASGVCAECGGEVTVRSSDAPPRLAERTARFHQQLPHIQRALAAQQVPWRALDADQPPERILSETQAVLRTHLLKETT